MNSLSERSLVSFRERRTISSLARARADLGRTRVTSIVPRTDSSPVKRTGAVSRRRRELIEDGPEVSLRLSIVLLHSTDRRDSLLIGLLEVVRVEDEVRVVRKGDSFELRGRERLLPDGERLEGVVEREDDVGGSRTAGVSNSTVRVVGELSVDLENFSGRFETSRLVEAASRRRSARCQEKAERKSGRLTLG